MGSIRPTTAMGWVIEKSAVQKGLGPRSAPAGRGMSEVIIPLTATSDRASPVRARGKTETAAIK